MTEEIPSDRHRKNPSSAEIEVAERMAVIKERLRHADSRDTIMSTQLDIIIGKLSKIETGMAVGERRMNEIDKHLENTDTALEALKVATATSIEAIKKTVDEDKRGPVAIILSTLGALAGGLGAYFGISK